MGNIMTHQICIWNNIYKANAQLAALHPTDRGLQWDVLHARHKLQSLEHLYAVGVLYLPNHELDTYGYSSEINNYATTLSNSKYEHSAHVASYYKQKLVPLRQQFINGEIDESYFL